MIMRRAVMLTMVLGTLVATPAGADVIVVPDAIRHMGAPHEEVHALRALNDGAPLGEQRYRAVVQGDRLLLDVSTRFTDGEQWDEHAEMSLAGGYRATAFAKVGRRGGRVVSEQKIDFANGEVTWLQDGQRGERSFAFAPDTYIGPMLGVILAGVPERPLGTASLQTVVFRPDPSVYTLRADVIDQENLRLASGTAPATKVRLKADLGPVQNVLFASLIPTHYFWFTREEPPEFLAFEGALGYGGRELRMLPKRPPTSTTKAERTIVTPR